MGTASLSQPSSDDQRRARKVRRFTIAVSLAMIILCNAIVLVGLWASGINLDELVTTPDVFNSKQDICLRLGWQSVTGAAEPVSSLLGMDQSIRSVRQDSSDSTGDQASARAGRAVLCGSGGHADYRLLILVLVVVAVIAFGLVAKWYLVGRYRLRLESAAGHGASLIH